MSRSSTVLAARVVSHRQMHRALTIQQTHHGCHAQLACSHSQEAGYRVLKADSLHDQRDQTEQRAHQSMAHRSLPWVPCLLQLPPTKIMMLPPKTALSCLRPLATRTVTSKPTKASNRRTSHPRISPSQPMTSSQGRRMHLILETRQGAECRRSLLDAMMKQLLHPALLRTVRNLQQGIVPTPWPGIDRPL